MTWMIYSAPASGVNAVLAASRSVEVVAVDINPHALAAA
jgi:methylase of polypeptide subunit release factors